MCMYCRPGAVCTHYTVQVYVLQARCSLYTLHCTCVCIVDQVQPVHTTLYMCMYCRPGTACTHYTVHVYVWQTRCSLYTLHSTSVCIADQVQPVHTTQYMCMYCRPGAACVCIAMLTNALCSCSSGEYVLMIEDITEPPYSNYRLLPYFIPLTILPQQ